MDYYEIAFQDGDKTLRVKVPLVPPQLWFSLPNNHWFGAVTETVRAVLAATSPPPLITYSPPSPSPYPVGLIGGRFQVNDDGVIDTLPYDGEGDDTTESNVA